MKRLFFLLCVLVSCSEQSDQAPFEMIQIKGVAMTIPYVMTIGERTTPEEQQNIQKMIEAVFEQTYQLYSHYHPESEISKINQAGTETLLISTPMEKLLQKVHRYYILSQGRYDPTIASVASLWKEAFQNHEMINDETLERYRAAVGWQTLTIAQGTLTKSDARTQIDLSGIAKGQTVDELVLALKTEGFQNFIVDWGGEIAASGKHPSGRPWRLFISHLGDANPEHALAIVELQDAALATSGNYLQQWKLKDELYTHIIDPRTLKPLKVTQESIASASVKARCCADADAIATALMLFDSLEAAQEWARDLEIDGNEEIQVWMERNSNL